MLLESLVKATMELQGFRVMAVTGTRVDWWLSWSQTCGFRPAVASAGRRAGTGTRGEHGAFGTCHCGGSRWRSAMRHGAYGVLGALASMSNRCRGSAANSR